MKNGWGGTREVAEGAGHSNPPGGLQDREFDDHEQVRDADHLDDRAPLRQPTAGVEPRPASTAAREAARPGWRIIVVPIIAVAVTMSRSLAGGFALIPVRIVERATECERIRGRGGMRSGNRRRKRGARGRGGSRDDGAAPGTRHLPPREFVGNL